MEALNSGSIIANFYNWYYREIYLITGETNSIDVSLTIGNQPVYIDFIDMLNNLNITNDKITVPGGVPLSELVITCEQDGAWLRYKINGKYNQKSGSSLLKDGEDRIVRPMHPRCIKSILIYAVENPNKPLETTATTRLNCMT